MEIQGLTVTGSFHYYYYHFYYYYLFFISHFVLSRTPRRIQFLWEGLNPKRVEFTSSNDETKGFLFVYSL